MLRTMTQILARFVLLFYVLSVIPVSAYAQDVDLEGPIVTLDQTPQDPASAEQMFALLATDEGGVESVTLFHRLAGDTEYNATLMQMDPSAANRYTAIVQINVTSDTRLEYYIQAEDAVGNSVLKGYFFDPLFRSVTPTAEDVTLVQEQAVVELLTEPVVPVATQPRKSRTLLYTVLGVLAVGALVGSAGGGGGAPTENGSCTGENCLLTINFPVPQ